jgi:hypothetical protein
MIGRVAMLTGNSVRAQAMAMEEYASSGGAGGKATAMAQLLYSPSCPLLSYGLLTGACSVLCLILSLQLAAACFCNAIVFTFSYALYLTFQ